MNDEVTDLERLISRYLDDEATRDERRQLRKLSADPQVAATVDEYETLDREFGRALRVAMGRTLVLPTGRSRWAYAFQVVGFAAAACIAALFWMHPRATTRSPGLGQDPQRASWFVRSPGDVQPSAFQSQPAPARPPQRHWIIVPGSHPGEYMVIEIDRVRPRGQPARDF